MRFAVFIILLLCLPGAAHAFPAIISSCHDGDSCTAEANGETIKIRIHGIDAPEMALEGKWPDQPYAWQSHALVDNLILGQTVDIQPTGQTSYGRIVADIEYRDTDTALVMVERGAAWVDERFTHDKGLLDAEHRAQAAGIGLWHKGQVIVPPWEWRRMNWKSGPAH